jgi:dTDP-4-amino-4,6-dideoxygalactose transaminase
MGRNIPLVDLRHQHAEVAEEIRAGWDRVVSCASFIRGDDVARFETEFASFCGTTHCIGVASGTDALELGLRVIGVGPGDEVIVPANSFIASAVAVSRTGATPVFVDVDEETLLVELSGVERRIGPRTRAVMAVHLYGQMAPLAPLLKLTANAGVALVEDVAQAHGARQDATSAGSAGVVAATSFYPGKNLGAYGDAGAVLTDGDELAASVRALGNYGAVGSHLHEEVGFNSRLDTLQAVVLLAKLRRLEAWNAQRRDAAARYETLLGDLDGVALPVTSAGNEHVWHLYVVRVAERDRVVAELRAAGIAAAVHYPVPIHLEPAYAELGYREGDFPLPMCPGISPAQQERVADELCRVVR